MSGPFFLAWSGKKEFKLQKTIARARALRNRKRDGPVSMLARFKSQGKRGWNERQSVDRTRGFSAGVLCAGQIVEDAAFDRFRRVSGLALAASIGGVFAQEFAFSCLGHGAGRSGCVTPLNKERAV